MKKKAAAPVRDARSMLAGMTPVLEKEQFVFCSAEDRAHAEKARGLALGWFREEEGFSMILELEAARSLGFATAMPMRRIVLQVFSALDGVGLTAAVSSTLADAGIPCNVVAAYHHDHLFVPASMADRALSLLQAVQAQAARAG